MRLRIADPDLVIEIHDDWFEEAGALGFRALAEAYLAKPDTTHAEFPMLIVPFAQVVPPRRDPGGFITTECYLFSPGS